ncbi:hypothetical protein G3N30_10100 [Microbacterium lacticum]|uniref:hypothetical protein n=1 Tax=Microbacterium lacticum TaxID=33885 RepID=UPI0018B0BE18|nr:hypothetical protein [Microbacterium lacticum]MBF9336554.1 hypothetical protein [Microbacterium lacticum]
MSGSGIRKADATAFAALVVVAVATSFALAIWTDVPSAARWAITVGAGIVAAAVTYALVSRRRR